MPVSVLHTNGGRDGHAKPFDGSLDVALATPKALGGGVGKGNTPEQLVATGYADCFIGAMKFVASQGGTANVPADASVETGPRSGGDSGREVALAVSLPGLPRAEVEALIVRAHETCPNSNAPRGSIDVKLSVV